MTYTLWDWRSLDPVAMCDTLDEALDVVLSGIKRNGTTDTDTLALVYDKQPKTPPVQIAQGAGVACLARERFRKSADYTNERCGTCRWWHRDDDPTSTLPTKTCLLTECKDGHNPVHPESKAVAEDWESYRAVLKTTEDFYCNQYEAINVGVREFEIKDLPPGPDNDVTRTPYPVAAKEVK